MIRGLFMCQSGIEVREVIHIRVEGQMSLWVQAMPVRGKFTSQHEGLSKGRGPLPAVLS